MERNRRIKVYIASPYTRGNVAENVGRQMRVGDLLINMGFAPYIPTLTHFMEINSSHTYETWMELDFEWVRVCDCLLRLDGISEGADRETALAYEIGIPVFYSIKDLLEWKTKNDTILEE